MEDLVLPGKLEQFKPQWRCEACQNRNTPCVIQAECDRCIACAGAACDCYFVRTIVKRASKTTFSWNELTHKPDIPDPPIDEDFLKTDTETHQAPVTQNHIIVNHNLEAPFPVDGDPRTALNPTNIHSGESEGQPSDRPHLIESLDEPSALAKETESNHTQKKLCCPFHSLSCFQRFDSFQDWLKHSLVHFNEVGPPPSVPCGSCDKTFSRSCALESWKEYMTHLINHQREGDGTAKSSLHLDLYKYMYEKSLITSSGSNIQTLLADLARRPPHSDNFFTGRLGQLRTPPTFNQVTHVSPGLSTTNSTSLFPNLQKSATLNSSRKRRLSSNGKEHARSARKQGAACEDCRKKKKRCIHFFNGEIGNRESQDLVYQYSSPVAGGVRIKEANEMSDEEPLIRIRKFQDFGMAL